VSNFLAYIEAKYREHYVPSQQPSFDEPLRSFKEKISFVTQNPKNPEYTCWQQAVPWIRLLIAGLSPKRPGLIHVGFLVDRVALGQVFLRVLRFSPVNISFHCHCPNSYHLGNA
jgi:hypothetical protein